MSESEQKVEAYPKRVALLRLRRRQGTASKRFPRTPSKDQQTGVWFPRGINVVSTKVNFLVLSRRMHVQRP